MNGEIMEMSLSWRRRAAAGVAAFALCVLPVAQAAADCSLANASPAGKIRRLQTFMMVAALKCREHKEFRLATKYNSFINRYNGELKKSAAVLTSQFRQLYGAEHQQRIDRFVTSLANDAARQSVWFSEWCGQMSTLGDNLSTGQGVQLLDVADRLPSQPIPDGQPQIGCAPTAAPPPQAAVQ